MSFASGVGIGFGQGAAKAETGSDPLASQQNGQQGQPAQQSGYQSGVIPLKSQGGQHWSVVPMLQHALGMGGQQPAAGGAQTQAQPQNGGVLQTLGHIFGFGGGQQQAQPAAAPQAQSAPAVESAGPTAALSAGMAPGSMSSTPLSITSMPGTQGGNVQTAQPATQQASPIRTQTQSYGFNGAVPMLSHMWANHQAASRDASAQPHIDALQQPNITPEQRNWHMNQLQNTYKNQPEVLQQLGLPVTQSGYSVPNVIGARGTY